MKTTPKHFALFKKECQYWIDKFGLKEWDIAFQQMNLESNDPDSVTGAQCVADLKNRVSAIVLQADWDIKVTNRMVKQMAFHEVCHLLLWRLVWLAQQRSISEGEATAEAHTIIRRLENGILNVK